MKRWAVGGIDWRMLVGGDMRYFGPSFLSRKVPKAEIR